VSITDQELLANKRYKTFNPLIPDYENFAAYGQSGANRIWNSGVNFVNKIGSYTLQNAGFIGGAAFAAAGGIANYVDKTAGGTGKIINNGNAVSLMSDNFLTKIGDAWKEAVQEANPIYKTDKYTQGSIWQKLASSSWWLDDAMDRASLTISMLVPGILESATPFNLAGLAERGGMLESKGVVTKLIQKELADNPELYGKLAKEGANAVYEEGATGGIAATGNVDMATNVALNFKNAVRTAQRIEITSFNVIGQNGLNARGTQTSITKSLTEQRGKGLNNYTDEEIKNLSADGGRASFWWNMPLTLLSSMWELPQVFSSMRGSVSFL
jgi:hypothetical protein